MDIFHMRLGLSQTTPHQREQRMVSEDFAQCGHSEPKFSSAILGQVFAKHHPSIMPPCNVKYACIVEGWVVHATVATAYPPNKSTLPTRLLHY